MKGFAERIKVIINFQDYPPLTKLLNSKMAALHATVAIIILALYFYFLIKSQFCGNSCCRQFIKKVMLGIIKAPIALITLKQRLNVDKRKPK